MSCVVKTLLKVTDNIDTIVGAAQRKVARQRQEETIANAKTKGRYVGADEYLNQYVQNPNELVGKYIKMEDIDSNDVSYTKVDKVVILDSGRVKINDKEIIDLTIGRSKGTVNSVVGSENVNGMDDVIRESRKLQDINGTVIENLEEVFNEMLELDGDRLSEEHKDHLIDVLNTYYNVLSETGNDIEFTAEVFKSLDEQVNTRGDASPSNGKLRLVLGNQVNHTMSEILAHELQHVLIYEAIKNNAELKADIREFREAFKEHLTAKYGKGNEWKVFSREGMDERIAKEEYEYTINNNTKEDMDEFLAAITTNEKLVKEVGGMTVYPGELLSRPKDTSTKFGRLLDKIVQLINKVYQGVKGTKRGEEVAIALLDKALRIAHKDTRKESQDVVDKALGVISKADKKMAKFTKEIDREYTSYAEYLASREPSAMDKAMEKIWSIRWLANARSFALQNNVFNSLARNMDNKYISQFYQMFRHSKAFIEREVVALKNVTASTLDNEYGFNQLSGEHRRSMKRVLIDTDAKALGDAEDILFYLENPDEMQKELDKALRDLNSDTLEAIEELATVLATNKGTKRNGFTNAHQIAYEYEQKNTDYEKAIRNIDVAVTIMALQKSSELDKTYTIDALRNSTERINKVFNMLNTNEAEILRRAYNGEKMYQVKGAKQEVYAKKNGIEQKHYLVSEKEMKELVKAGMANIGIHEELSRVLGEDRYVVIGDSVDIAYTEGMMSVVQLKNEGDSLRAIMQEMGMTEEEVEQKIDELADEYGEVDGAMLPERTGTGLIYDYKIRLSREAKESYLNVDSDIVSVVSATIANLTHKQEAMLNNTAALIHMREFYRAHRGDNKFKFIEISEDSAHKKGKEYWDLMPFYMKRNVLISKEPLMIEESLLVDFFGYKDASISNLPWVKDKVKRQLVAKKMESILKEVVASWKKKIVAFTPATIRGNMLSNMILGMQHTKSKDPLKYMSRFRDIWIEMNKYQELRKQFLVMRVNEQAGVEVDKKEMARLERTMETSRVHNIMKDGQYNAILEDINTDYFDNKGMVESKVDEYITKLQKGNEKGNLKDFVDLLYIRKDSRMHDSIMKFTTFSDAINKVIILEDLAEENKGQITQDMLNYVDSIHVNYAYLDNKYIKYANDIGLFTFTKYFFRVLPAMVKMAGNKMVSMATTESVIGLVGIGETPVTQFWNPFDSIMRKVSLWGRPDDFISTILTPRVL